MEEWARDFEKLEAVAYHKAAASEVISEVEAKRLLEAVEAATTKEQTSIGLLQNFMSQSGDPAISDTFREIQMEAVTLLSARNDATRRAAKANSRLVKTCAPRVAKFIQNPFLDHQKTANSSTAATLLNTIHASGLLAGSRPAGVEDQTGGQRVQQRPH